MKTGVESLISLKAASSIDIKRPGRPDDRVSGAAPALSRRRSAIRTPERSLSDRLVVMMAIGAVRPSAGGAAFAGTFPVLALGGQRAGRSRNCTGRGGGESAAAARADHGRFSARANRRPSFAGGGPSPHQVPGGGREIALDVRPDSAGGSPRPGRGNLAQKRGGRKSAGGRGAEPRLAKAPERHHRPGNPIRSRPVDDKRPPQLFGPHVLFRKPPNQHGPHPRLGAE